MADNDWKKTSTDLTYVIRHESVEPYDSDVGLDHTTTGVVLQCHSHYPYRRGYVYEPKLLYILT